MVGMVPTARSGLSSSAESAAGADRSHRHPARLQLAQAEEFALAGGAALVVRGDVDRRTRDLDFFGPSALAVDELLPAEEQALLSDGLQVERIIDHPGFARLLVSDATDQTEVDLGTDARLLPVEERLGIRLLSSEELAVDKLLALFGRAEARDFVDLLAVADRYGLDRLLDLASEKERRFDAAVFAEMLTRIDRLPRIAFPLDDAQYDKLQETVGTWRECALHYARERHPHRGIPRDRGPDLGLGR